MLENMNEQDKAVLVELIKQNQPVQSIPFSEPNLTPTQDFLLKKFISDNSASSTIKTGQADKLLSAASTTQTIAHGLGKIPSYIRIIGLSGSGANVISTIGTYDGTTMYFSSLYGTAVNWGSAYIVNLSDGTNQQEATVTLDATNINLTWTKVAGGLGGTLHFIWEVS